MKKEKIIFYLLFAILVGLGVYLRFFALTQFPPSLNWDEISHGYNAFSILKTGADEWGKLFPIINFRAYGDYPLPLNLYLTIPSIFFFGLNEFSVRLPHMILGVLTIIAAYFLGLGISKNKYFGLLTGFLVAVDPWFLFTSCVVLQSNISVFLLISSMAAFFNRGKHKFLFPASLFLLFLTLFSYHSTRIFSPFLLISLVIVYKNELRRFFNINSIEGKISVLIIMLFAVTSPVIFLNKESRARTQWVFLIDQGAVNRIVEQRQASPYSEIVKRLLYNRPAYFIREFSKNYIQYFSPQYLFQKGGTQYQFSLPNHGLLYLINLPLFYIGLVYLLNGAFKKKDKICQFLLGWLMLSPISASMTLEKMAVLRSSTMLPLPEILSVLGFYYVLGYLKKNKVLKILLTVIYVAAILYSLKGYVWKLNTEYPKTYSWSWQYGYKEVVTYVKENYDKYDKIIITKKYGEPHEYFLFYLSWDPLRYRNDPNLVRFYQTGWYWVDSFDKFYFVNDWEIPKNSAKFVLESKKEFDCQKESCLLITSSGNFPKGWSKLKQINFLSGESAFEIYENR